MAVGEREELEASGTRADRLELVRVFLLPVSVYFFWSYVFLPSFCFQLEYSFTNISVSVTQQTLDMTNVLNTAA
jgi:hypothetical protein